MYAHRDCSEDEPQHRDRDEHDGAEGDACRIEYEPRARAARFACAKLQHIDPFGFRVAFAGDARIGG